MADETEITGVSLDAESMWATERVQEKLLEALVKLLNLTQKQQQEMKNGFKDMKETGKVTKDNIKSQKTKGGGGGNMFADTTDGLAKFGTNVVDAADDLDDMASGPMKKFGKGITGLTKKMGLMGGLAAGLMSQIGAAISTIKETVDAMRDLNSIGITIEGDFLQFQEMLKDSATTIAELSSITSKYARTVGNVGLKALVDMTVAAESSTFAFKDYGLRLAEGAEFQAEMLEADRFAGIFRKRDQHEQSLMLAENIKTLSAYSKILNVSREDMIKARIETKSRADVQRRFNSFDDDKREGASRSLDQFTDIMASLGEGAEGATRMMITILADAGAVTSAEFEQVAGAAPEVAAAFLKLRAEIESGMDITPDMVIERLLAPLDAATKSGQIEQLSLNKYIGETATMLGGPLLNSLRNWQYRMDQIAVDGETQEQTLKRLADKTNKSVQKATEAQTELDRFAATVKAARVKVFDNLLGQEASTIMDSAITGLRLASQKIDEFSDLDFRGMLGSIVDDFKLYVVEPFRTSMMWLNDLVSEMMVTFSTFFNWLQDIPARIWNAMAKVLPIDPVDLPSAASSHGWTPAAGAPSRQEVTVASQASRSANKNLAEAALDPGRIKEMEILERTATVLQLTYDLLKKERFKSMADNTIQ